MKPPAFAYRAVRSLDEAMAALAESAGEARLLAGGQSLVPMMNFRLVVPALVIDINHIAGLDFVAPDEAGGVRIGALTRHRTLETAPLVTARFPILAAAMAHVAHLAIRNRGTIGGSLAHADPAAELPMLALLLDARIKTAAPDGGRLIPAGDFCVGALTTALDEDEMIVEIGLPALPAATGWGFEEFARRSGDFAIVAVGAILTVRDGRCADARIALAGVGERPVRTSAAEAVLKDHGADPDAIAAAARAVRDAAEPTSDLHASADFRRHLVEVLTRRALQAAWRRAADIVAAPAMTAPSPTLPRGHGGGKDPRSREGGGRQWPIRVTGSDFGETGDGLRRIRVVVNGTGYERVVAPRLLLCDFLRDELGLTGTHIGCEHGVCGACTIIVGGDSVRSCLMFAVQADGKTVETVEGLGTVEALNPVQAAFREHHALQCGFCTPGMLMTTVDLLRKRALASDAEIRDGLSGNLCRCTGYQHIVAAVRALAAARSLAVVRDTKSEPADGC